MNLQHTETRARQAIVSNNVAAYKYRHPGWHNNPAVKKAILVNTLGSWQVLALVVFTGLLATLFLALQQLNQLVAVIITLLALVAGAITAVLWVWMRLNSKRQQDRAITQIISQQTPFSLNAINAKQTKIKLVQALQYWSYIDSIVETVPYGPLRDQAALTQQDATRWLQEVYQLALKTDSLQLSLARHPELKTGCIALEKQQQRLNQETNPQTRAQIQQAIAYQLQRLKLAQMLQKNVEQAHQQLDSTLTAMGTVHSQLLLIANNQQTKQTCNLQKEISEEVLRLQDITEAMNEVYQTAAA